MQRHRGRSSIHNSRIRRMLIASSSRYSSPHSCDWQGRRVPALAAAAWPLCGLGQRQIEPELAAHAPSTTAYPDAGLGPSMQSSLVNASPMPAVPSHRIVAYAHPAETANSCLAVSLLRPMPVSLDRQPQKPGRLPSISQFPPGLCGRLYLIVSSVQTRMQHHLLDPAHWLRPAPRGAVPALWRQFPH